MNYKKIMIVALVLLIAVISFTKIAPAAADPANHKHSIEKTEEKIASVIINETSGVVCAAGEP